MLPSVAALGFASPSGVVGWSVRHGVDPLLIGLVLHRLNAEAAVAALPNAKPSRMDGAQRSQNLAQAWQRVKANKGAPGIDGMTVEDFPAFRQEHWPRIAIAIGEGNLKECRRAVRCRPC